MTTMMAAIHIHSKNPLFSSGKSEIKYDNFLPSLKNDDPSVTVYILKGQALYWKTVKR